MFWENFVSLCAERGISPNAVAAELSLSSGSVTAWKGGTVPRETTLKKIANYFGVSVDYLIGFEQKEKPALKKESGLNPKYYELNQENQTLVNSLIEQLLKSQFGD